jgi:uncharacterized phage infection (PIP) family protein YhgE
MAEEAKAEDLRALETAIKDLKENISHSLNSFIEASERNKNLADSINDRFREATESINTRFGDVTRSIDGQIKQATDSINTRFGDVTRSIDGQIKHVTDLINEKFGWLDKWLRWAIVAGIAAIVSLWGGFGLL